MDRSYDSLNARVMQDMNEGVLVIGNDGKILMTNNKTISILEKEKEELEGRKFATVFFGEEENDAFNQTILDAIYDMGQVHSNVVSYHTGDRVKYINVISSGLKEDNRIIGVIIVLSDITELVEVREHLKMMRQIEELNEQLEERNRFIRKAFGRYLSDEIVQKVLDTPDGLSVGGNMEHITVLMSDLRGFTAMCESVPPGDLITVLNHYLDGMGKIIKEMNGTVIEYVGDGILAIFGAPVKDEDHGLNAVIAAVKMQQEMEKINKWNEAHGYPILKMGIGINTGDAVVGNMGSEYAMKYNVIGSCVNLCGRIESYTTDGQIFISDATKEEIKTTLTIDDEMKITPKGVKEEMLIHSVKGVGEPYNISYKLKKKKITPLEKKEKVTLHTLEGKHVSTEGTVSYITGRSSEEILLETKVKLDIFDNVVLKGEECDLYCKVTAQGSKGIVLTVTGKN